VYPYDYYRGVHKKSTHDYTGTSGVDEYWNSVDSNPITGCVSYGTGITGHVMLIEYALGLTPGGTHANVKGWLESIDTLLGPTPGGTHANVKGWLESIDTLLGPTPGGTHANVKGWLNDLDRRTHAQTINWFLSGTLPEGAQFISGISFGPHRVQLAGLEVNLLTAPEGSIGGHFDLYNAPDGGGAKLLSLHLAEGDLWGSAIGSSYLESAQPLYVYTITSSTMANANLTLHLQ